MAKLSFQRLVENELNTDEIKVKVLKRGQFLFHKIARAHTTLL